MGRPSHARVAFCTLGCKTNQYDTQSMKEQFLSAGYDVVDFDSFADVYVINTCTVTNLADRKSRQAIQKANKKNPESIVAVVGCYPQRAAAEVLSVPGVDIVAGTNERAKIVDLVENHDKSCTINAVNDIFKQTSFEEVPVKWHHEKTRAVVKIQDGCNQFCSYCIIPYVRGPVRSRNTNEILREAKDLAISGYREIVLTGIHIASYGNDLHDTDLLRLLSELHSVEGIDRLRLGSVDPRLLTRQFIKTASELPKLCPHYHVSLQSGSDRILKLMNRNYTTDQYGEIVDDLRTNIPDVAVTTDLMVGFPGETDEDFENTLNFVNDIQFSRIHVFRYSDRKNTPAADFAGKIPQAIKDERGKKLIKLGEQLEIRFMSTFLDKKVSVLVEDKCARYENCFEGHTTNYIKVFINSKVDLSGEIVTVIPERIEKGVMIANF
jgi:threonylcarbamoyladenosine tRNA methylthiotransferase MtaB